MNLGVKSRTILSPAVTIIDAMNVFTGWAVLVGTPQVAVASLTGRPHAVGTDAVAFNGGASGALADGMAKTFTALDLSAAQALTFFIRPEGGAASAVISARFGTSDSVYWEHVFPAATFTDGVWAVAGVNRSAEFTAVGGISLWSGITRIGFLGTTSGGGAITIDQIAALFVYSEMVLAESSLQAYWRLGDSGLPQDSSPNHYHMTTDSNSTAQVAGLLKSDASNKARGFTAASSSYITVGGSLFDFTNLTVEFLIKRTRTGVTEYVCSQYNGGFGVQIQANGTIALTRSFHGIIAVSSTLKLTDTGTHHVAITRNGVGGTVTFYVDGVSEVGTSGASFSETFSSSSNGFFVGSEWTASPVDGTIDELAVYNSVLSSGKITSHYNAL